MRNANCKDLFFNKIYFEKFYSTKFWFKKVLVFVVIWSDCSKSMIHHNIYDGSTMKVQPGESIFSTPPDILPEPSHNGLKFFLKERYVTFVPPHFHKLFIKHLQHDFIKNISSKLFILSELWQLPRKNLARCSPVASVTLDPKSFINLRLSGAHEPMVSWACCLT